MRYLQKFQVAVEQMVVEHKEQDPLAVVNQCQEFAADCSTLVDESMVEALPMIENNLKIHYKLDSAFVFRLNSLDVRKVAYK